jgi:hypothetical protein
VVGDVGEPGRSVASKVVSILNSFAVTEHQSLTRVARAAGLRLPYQDRQSGDEPHFLAWEDVVTQSGTHRAHARNGLVDGLSPSR